MNTSLVGQQIPQEEVEMKSTKTEVRKNTMVCGAFLYYHRKDDDDNLDMEIQPGWMRHKYIRNDV
ncbi:MAG: hypothetical protein WA364_29775 [Candidatus Nitrosopolaris sp.]